MKAFKHLYIGIFCFVLGVIFLSSCRKDQILTDSSARLAFSTDTLTFDTVFTTIGSTTDFFKIYNTNNKKLIVSSIQLANGEQSMFRLNVDGLAGKAFTDIEIGANDSVWVFVEVTIDPNNVLNPLIIMDSIQFVTNGNRQHLPLVAWGQDAHIHNAETVQTETWTNDKPHVIFRFLEIDSGHTLTINEGVQIHLGGRAGIIVDGTATINVVGTIDDPVVFQGVRLETFYDLPGQWLGIFILRGSTGNSMEHAIIKNSENGIALGSSPIPDLSTFTGANAPDLTLNKVTIKNSFNNALFGFLSAVVAENCLFYNSNDHLITMGLGGFYRFRHCTFVNYGSATLNHQKPNVLMSNFAESNDIVYQAVLDVAFINSIIHGSLEEEFEFSNYNDPDTSTAFNYVFNHCLIKTKLDINQNQFINVSKNKSPQFVNRFEEDFSLLEGSIAIDSGLTTLSITDDLLDQPRDLLPDLGAIEYVP